MDDLLPDSVKPIGPVGNPGVFIGYLVQGSSTAVVESGPSKTADEYSSQIATWTKGLSWILVSHVHIDHAGGAWKLAQRFQTSRVGVYEKGAKHLVDPSRLSDSAKQALGPLYDIWGEIRPVPSDRVVSFRDGEAVSLGPLTMRLIAAPGHAPHSSVWYLEEERVLFTGDSMGVYIPLERGGVVWPTSPPPSFDYELSMETIRRLTKLKIDHLCFPHYSYTSDVGVVTNEIVSAYERWFSVTKEGLEKGWSERKILEEYLAPTHHRELVDHPYLSLLLYMDLHGMLGYHKKRIPEKNP